MLKAHSLLYSVYVCLIVAILCGALLYFATLYNQLNLFYNSNESLYIQNQSAVNFALGTGLKEESVFINDTSNVKSDINIKPFGLLNLLTVSSYIKADTVTSTHFAGNYSADKTCIYLSSFSKSLSYAGKVKLNGNKYMPSFNIDAFYVNNFLNELSSSGALEMSESSLPKINSNFKKIVETPLRNLSNLNSVERKIDSVYFNSFQNETIEIQINNSILENIVLKGNFIIYSKDSIQIKSSAILEDVIIKSPKITFKEGFKGNVQAFSTRKIKVEKDVNLNYPSVLCLYNSSKEESLIKVDEESKIYGAIVQFGNSVKVIDENSIQLCKNTLVVGDVYCQGKLMVEGKVYGSVYTNRFFHKTEAATYENCIINAVIDVNKRPSYFVSIPLFENQKPNYGIYKKVL